MAITNFKDLVVWQKSHAVVLEIYKITNSFPEKERFGLTSQIQRAAISITSNIAEGFGRNSAKDKNQFYSIARGSAFEVQNQIITAKDLGYCNREKSDKIEAQLIEVQKMISGLMKSSVDR